MKSLSKMKKVNKRERFWRGVFTSLDLDSPFDDSTVGRQNCTKLYDFKNRPVSTTLYQRLTTNPNPPFQFSQTTETGNNRTKTGRLDSILNGSALSTIQWPLVCMFSTDFRMLVSKTPSGL
ncbi:MAG: hypothetical protein L0Y58_03290 [Verrucomicrobia subdivision 3 bacterium]|nr:hypothetical protein [Limisphaerales bacterium]